MESMDLNLELEELKMQLCELVNERQSFVDPSVVQLSQRIDSIIVRMQRCSLKKRGNIRN